jgi:hypothetical protein
VIAGESIASYWVTGGGQYDFPESFSGGIVVRLLDWPWVIGSRPNPWRVSCCPGSSLWLSAVIVTQSRIGRCSTIVLVGSPSGERRMML